METCLYLLVAILLPKINGFFYYRYSYAKMKLGVKSTYRTSWGVANGEIDEAIVGE